MFIEKDQLIPDFCHLCHFREREKGKVTKSGYFTTFCL